MRKIKALIVFACLLICKFYWSNAESLSNNVQMNVIEIGFTPHLTAPDLQIKRLTAVAISDSILFTLNYSSKEDRYLSFFNPPDGDILKYIVRNGIKKSDTVVNFSIAKNKLSSLLEITMRFSKKGFLTIDRNFIFLDLYEPSTIKLLGNSTVSINGKPVYNSSTSKPNENNSQLKPANIKFISNISSTDLKIKSLNAFIDNDQVVFTLTYSSQKNRFLSFFNPPKGDVLMYLDRTGINKSDTTVTVRIPKMLFRSVKNITLRFSTNKDAESDRNFIYLDMSEPILKNMIGKNTD